MLAHFQQEILEAIQWQSFKEGVLHYFFLLEGAANKGDQDVSKLHNIFL
jgi:hypothetical protein